MVTIDFSAVRPNEISLEGHAQWENSTFRLIYQSAVRCLQDIVWAGNRTKEPFQLQSPDSQNRVMALVGDRGTGKTSAMVSFVNACVDGSVQVYKSEDIYGSKQRPCSFYSLPVIEPSSFSDGESIVGCVVSQIYSELEEQHSKLERSLIQTIINQCTDIREAIRVCGMSSQVLLEQNSDELSHLRLLAQTKRLQERLIDSYLTMHATCDRKCQDCMRQDQTYAPMSSGPGYLIVPIDDIDTSIHNAYHLAEELRNYFMLPNVIVVMALKVEQLFDALEQSSCTLRIKESQSEPLVDYMLKLVYRRTGILLIPDKWECHPLIPHDLRSLHQMLSLFQKMEDTVHLQGPEGQWQYLDQLEQAEKWLLGHIASSQIPVNLIGILREFAAHQDQGLNAFLWCALSRALWENAVSEVRSLMDRSVRNDNISIGDVLHLLQVLDETDVEYDLALFGAAARMLYSIRLRRRMIQSLEMKAPDIRVDKALSDMPDEGYQSVWQLLNGLVYDPVQRLTYDGFERMYNGDATAIKVFVPTDVSKDGKNTYQFYDIRSGALVDCTSKDKKPMSLKEAVWISMFIVGFGRVRRRDIHSLETPILTGILPIQRQGLEAGAVQSTEPAYLSSNWMAFAHNLLVPQCTAKRLLWCVIARSTEAKKAFYAEVDELKKIRFAVLFQCLHLDSADFLHRLVCHMTTHTEEIFQARSDGLATFSGFFDFKEGLDDGIECVMAHSCLNEEIPGKDELNDFLRVSNEPLTQNGTDSQNNYDYSQYDWMMVK